MQKKARFDNSIFRLIIRNIEGFVTFIPSPPGTKRTTPCAPLEQLKQRLLDLLLLKQSKRPVKLINWSISWEIHPSSGLPHFDILLVYNNNLQASYNTFDYLIKDLKIQQKDVGDQIGIGHVWVTPYSSKKLNKAILDYGEKEDPSPLSNLSLHVKEDLVRVNLLKADPYRYLQLQMLKDPLNFNLQEYVRTHDLFQYLSSWSSIKSKLKDSQFAAANLLLKSKPGFRFIDRALIQSQLSSEQLKTYDSWNGYQTIVNYLNQMVTYKFERPFKSKQLFLIGRPNIGKTSLVRQLQKHSPIYHMDVSNWFPNYRDNVYSAIFWDEFKLKGGLSHTDLLKFLQGSPMDLQYKGGSSLRRNNQLVILTSNMHLTHHIYFKFKDKEQIQLALQNLYVRIEQLLIPHHLNLFLLIKLIVPAY